MLNSSDVAADFVGTAQYAANGYGFIGLVCSLITGTATFTEKVVKDVGCCDDVYWWDNQENYGSNNGQGNYYTLWSGWYGPGANNSYNYGNNSYYYDTGYFNPDRDQFNPYPYPNVVGGFVYTDSVYGVWNLPDQNESPFNPGPALTSHSYEINPTYQ
jgi:hypothetical protein